jgi:hypothetical protein
VRATSESIQTKLLTQVEVEWAGVRATLEIQTNQIRGGRRPADLELEVF